MLGGYILIVTILILGGIVAVSGDRIGTKVGKARLTLFKLRPRQTATLVTIGAGTVISGTVLTLIFGANEQLRTGVFDLQRIQNKLSETKANLDDAIQQKDRVQRELADAKNAKSEAEDVLSKITKSLKDELLKQSTAAQDINNIQQQLIAVSKERNDLVQSIGELDRQQGELKVTQKVLNSQIKDLSLQGDRYRQGINDLEERIMAIEKEQSQIESDTKIASTSDRLNIGSNRLTQIIDRKNGFKADLELQKTRLDRISDRLNQNKSELIDIESELQSIQQKIQIDRAKLAEKDRQHKQLEKDLETKATDVKLRDAQLKKLEAQIKSRGQGLATLEKEVNYLERQYKNVREGNIKILKNQLLAARVLKSTKPEVAAKEIQQLLDRANSVALQATSPEPEQKQGQIITFLPDRFDRLKQQIGSRGEYVVRIFAAGNYVAGDKNIQVFADATPNQKIFERGTIITAITIDPEGMDEERIRQQLDILLFTIQRRARQAGLLDETPTLGRGNLDSYMGIFKKLKERKYPIEIKAVVRADTYTADKLAIDLQTSIDGERSPLP
jgi:uncharacterized protein (DUF3084 family)